MSLCVQIKCSCDCLHCLSVNLHCWSDESFWNRLGYFLNKDSRQGSLEVLNNGCQYDYSCLQGGVSARSHQAVDIVGQSLDCGGLKCRAEYPVDFNHMFGQ